MHRMEYNGWNLTDLQLLDARRLLLRLAQSFDLELPLLRCIVDLAWWG